MPLLRWSPWSVSTGRELDPFFGLSDVLGDYDRQMRQMMREFNRLESQFMGGEEDVPLAVSSLVGRSAIVPRIVDKNGKKVAEYSFDVRGFKPEDVTIKTTDDNRLIVSGRHEEHGEDHQAIREFKRITALPADVKPEEMKTRLRDGILSIEAPLHNVEALEKKDVMEIPIQHEKGLKGDFSATRAA